MTGKPDEFLKNILSTYMLQTLLQQYQARVNKPDYNASNSEYNRNQSVCFPGCPYNQKTG
jgi:hypothetical protein